MSSLTSLSPLGPRPASARPRPWPRLEHVEDEAEEQGGERHTGRRLIAGGLLGLAGLSALGGVALHQAATAPVCQQTQQMVGWENGGPCVSRGVALGGATGWRYLQTPFHMRDALSSWNSGHHQILPAPADSPHTTAAGEVQVVSWNLHHGLSPDPAGARPQLDTMIDQLQQEDADIYLLQEVDPKFAGDIAEQLRMKGYYAVSTPVQGNLILLNPDIEVRGESVTVTTGADGWGTLTDWLTQGGGDREPRTLQVLDVTLPGGREAVIWNTHHLTGVYSPEQQAEAAGVVRRQLESHIQPGELVIGGGDLNASSPNSPILRELSHLDGVSGQAERIDWIYASDSSQAQFSHQRVEKDAIMVSDHPLVRAHLTLD